MTSMLFLTSWRMALPDMIGSKRILFFTFLTCSAVIDFCLSSFDTCSASGKRLIMQWSISEIVTSDPDNDVVEGKAEDDK